MRGFNKLLVFLHIDVGDSGPHIFMEIACFFHIFYLLFFLWGKLNSQLFLISVFPPSNYS